MPDELRVTRTVAIPFAELEWRFSASGGPGGQHANRSNTRVELRFDAAASTALGPVQRSRVVAALGPVVRVVAADERSQLRNREVALQRLAERLAGALHVERSRRETRPTKGSKERRLESKRRQAGRKRDRTWRPDD